MYIKPPAVNQARNVIRYADISLNSSYRTIMELSREAERRGVVHRVVIMLELGELREGITRDRAIEFYERVFELSHIKVIGLGTNLGCMYGVEPTFDKLIQLSLYTQLIKARFNRDLELISGGSSITLPLVGKRKIPPGVNHFRVGETAFLGKSLITGNRFGGLSTNAFDFSAEIVEIEKKEVEPDGTISNANVGQTAEIRPPESRPPETYRCLVDVGKLDVELDDLTLKNRQVRFIGTTSDMTVYDLGTERGKWRVGGKLHFRPNYMAVARLMNNRYVTKHVI
jgi:predicted amino acid racemase